MSASNRIPGFALCARCGVHRQLEACGWCGLLVCNNCRGVRECAVCSGERLASAQRSERRARLRELGRRVAVVGLVAASGATGLGAAFLPDGPPTLGAYEPMPVELRAMIPAPPEEAAASWHRPLVFRCYDAGQGVTCCVLTPRD